MLCQVQEEPKGTQPFLPCRTKIGKFQADTGAQVNIAGYDIFDLMGIPDNEKDKYLIQTRVKINGVRGSVGGGVKELQVHLYSLKTKRTILTVF